MTLKEAMTADLEVILNLEEHAREVLVDLLDGQGERTVTVILSGAEGELYGQPGVFAETMILRCKEADLDRPKVRQRLRVEGQEWFVNGVRGQAGELILELERRES